MQVEIICHNKEYNLKIDNLNLTLKEICILNGIPFQSVSFYFLKNKNYIVFTGLHKPLYELKDIAEKIIIRPDRNINFKDLICKGTSITKIENSVAEYTFSDPSDLSVLKLIEMNDQDCHKYVQREVTNFLNNDIKEITDQKIIIGVSGGGDSNTLIRSFIESGKVEPEQIVGVMMLGIPDWDLGKPRAEEICQKYGVELRFVTPEEVNTLLGRKNDNSDWVTDFENNFPDVDLEVLGTLAIRLSLSHIAKMINAQSVVIGLNLEDLLSECFLQVMKGMMPLPFPERQIDGVNIWYPLYMCPKKILDGCYPKYSLQNYLDRYESKLLGRAIPYYIAQMMHVIYPGVEFDIIRGFKELSLSNKNFTNYDVGLGFSTLTPVNLNERIRWEKFLNCPN